MTTTTTEAVTRPILFSGPMIRALLAGTKTQTRRIVKPQPFPLTKESGAFGVPSHEGDRAFPYASGASFRVSNKRAGPDNWASDCPCRLGQPGDRLWVREAATVFDIFGERRVCKGVRLTYSADSRMSEFIPWPERLKFTPVIGKAVPRGVFREASRITLEIDAVRVERLGEITPADALAEGIELPPVPLAEGRPKFPADLDKWDEDKRERWFRDTARAVYFAQCADADNHVTAFRELWESLYGPRSWEQSPWVWVLSFRRVEAPRA